MESKNVSVAVSGAVYWVPSTVVTEIVGTTDLAAAEGVIPLGFVAEDGVSITDDSSRDFIKAWQNNAKVRQVSSETSVTISANLIENTKNIRELYYRSAESVDGTIDWKPAQEVRGRLVVEYVDAGYGALEPGETLKGRYVFGDVTLSETEELTLVNGEALGYGVTWAASPDVNGSVAKIYTLVVTPVE